MLRADLQSWPRELDAGSPPTPDRLAEEFIGALSDNLIASQVTAERAPPGYGVIASWPNTWTMCRGPLIKPAPIQISVNTAAISQSVMPGARRSIPE